MNLTVVSVVVRVVISWYITVQCPGNASWMGLCMNNCTLTNSFGMKYCSSNIVKYVRWSIVLISILYVVIVPLLVFILCLYCPRCGRSFSLHAVELCRHQTPQFVDVLLIHFAYFAHYIQWIYNESYTAVVLFLIITNLCSCASFL